MDHNGIIWVASVQAFVVNVGVLMSNRKGLQVAGKVSVFILAT